MQAGPIGAYCRTFCVLTSPFITNDASSPITKLSKKFSQRQRSLNHLEKCNRRAKSPANNSCCTCIRYGCHLISILVIRLKLVLEIGMGLRRGELFFRRQSDSSLIVGRIIDSRPGVCALSMDLFMPCVTHWCTIYPSLHVVRLRPRVER